MLVLRTCSENLQSHGGFQWPSSGYVSAPDWSPRVCCGYGLHGLAWGQGCPDLMDWGPDAKWLVVEVNDATVVDLDGKVKFPNGNVVFCGDRHGATAYLAAHLPDDLKGKSLVPGLNVIVGDKQFATVGYRGTATAGNYGTATAGYRGTATAGEGGTLEISWPDYNANRIRRKIGYVGEDGILPNVKYQLNDKGLFVPVDQPKIEVPQAVESVQCNCDLAAPAYIEIKTVNGDAYKLLSPISISTAN